MNPKEFQQTVIRLQAELATLWLLVRQAMKDGASEMLTNVIKGQVDQVNELHHSLFDCEIDLYDERLIAHIEKEGE